MVQEIFFRPARTAILVLALLACTALVVAPACAASKYLGGAPSFTAAVAGDNEFSQGEDATITIRVTNTGTYEMEQVTLGTIEPEDLPNTAKTVTIGLGSSGDAVLVKTDPQMVGDIAGGGAVTVAFDAKISSNATVGEYQLPLTLQYRYPKVMSQEKADVYEFVYNTAEVTLPVTLRIKPEVKVAVLEAVPEQLTVGSEGYVNLKIQNTGPENGQLAVVKMVRNGNSPIIPTASTVYIGDFASGDVVDCRYRVSVSKDAEDQIYPVDIEVSYTDREGMVVTSSKETVGIPVAAKPLFTVISAVPEIPSGAEKTVDIVFRNDGSVTIYDAQVRITSHTPVTIGDNTGFLGSLAPGDTATARFTIAVDKDAEPAEYTFDGKTRFRDALGTSQESDTIPVHITVVPADPASSFLGGLPVFVGLAAAILVIGIAFLVYRKRSKNR